MIRECSILISNWRGKEAVALTIESILKRTDYPAFKIIVYDSSGKGSQDRQYLRIQEELGNIILLTHETHTLHDNAIPILLEHCDTELAVIMDSDVTINKNGRDWLRFMSNIINGPKMLGVARHKDKGIMRDRKTYIAPAFQPFCMMLNMPVFRKIEKDIHWKHQVVKIKDYKGSHVFREFRENFNYVFGDVGFSLAEKILFDNKEGLVMYPLPILIYPVRITHWGGISSLANHPEHPRVKTKWMFIKEELKNIRNES